MQIRLLYDFDPIVWGLLLSFRQISNCLEADRISILCAMLFRQTLHISDASSGWAGWALAYLEFGVLVNPTPIRGGADYAQHITACPRGFENLTASLHMFEHSMIIFKSVKVSIKVQVKENQVCNCNLRTQKSNVVKHY